jgi:hypothetical protein
MSNTQDATEEKGLFAMFKGDTGSGKSVGALSFCDTDNDGTKKGYVFDFDKKMPNIANKHFQEKSIDYDVFEDVFQVQEKMDSFFYNCPYETLIFDSLTALNILVFNTCGKQRGETAVQFLRNMQPPTTKNQDPNKMSIDYYNAQVNFLERYWLDTCKSLWARPGNPKNVIIIAHVMTVESAPDLRTKIVTRTRGIVTAGKAISAYVPTVFDDQWHFSHENDFETGKLRRLALTEAVGEDSAKTSYRLPAKIDFTGTPPFYEDGNLYNKFRKIISGDISL